MWISNPDHSFYCRYSLQCRGVQGYALAGKIGLKIRCSKREFSDHSSRLQEQLFAVPVWTDAHKIETMYRFCTAEMPIYAIPAILEDHSVDLKESLSS